MSRLIDADKLKDELKTLPIMSNWGELFMPILIDKQPTAYDIDKVVEQLEEKSITYCREYGYAEDENVLYLPDAIEIVKGGEE